MSPAPHPVRRLGTLPARARLAVVVPVVLAVLTGCSSAADKPAPASPNTPAAAGTASPAAPGATQPAVPTEVAIPSLGITSSLMELGRNTDGTVEVPPPEKGMTAGWYIGGSVPGEVGPAVIIGHNNTRFGKAVFHDLKKITKGADITVANNRGESARFTVTDTESVSKDSFPTKKVYGPTKDRALRLVTCDGDFDTEGHPVNNLIVYATLA
ncbi:class F sortase [Streptomyces sp. ActVer]|uniref:class F sortase n=1 Tax=Streptomyces sp. ActVer TaxID=3014558 RepID=UPI0022B59A11|nr:class F sortase [Streptomyces sp. ActVer]MCZ4514466.1 class F sortase [Streptomyces sp. ActVer]